MSEFKVKKCNSCNRFDSNLTQLPSGRFICDGCMEVKCKSDENEEETIGQMYDQIDAIDFFLDRNSRLKLKAAQHETKAAKVCRLRARINEFRADLCGYSAHVKRIVDQAR